ncbi:MAG: site-specific DNA-methyltransferase [Nitrospira sp.]|nr:site-specific DNA-methyltransferase [Nitrospira sp.]MCA9500713.1 site-specific DNA-methyltransferase [Nitrospira sp.]
MPSLNWIGKKAVERHHKEVPFHLLEPVPALSYGEADSGNLLVQGDNLLALKALLPRYAGQVKCIYIDPPYNTGNEKWAYNDNVNSLEIRKWLGEVVGKEGETLDRHDRWLCMMYPRLVLLKQFLREDGVIFISIDDNEVATLRLLMDEIFGISNFVATVAWQRRISPDARLGLSQAHDHILTFAKRKDLLEFYPIPLTGKQSKAFKNPDKDPMGPWTSTDFTAQGWRPNQMYPITTPGGITYEPPPGRCWANLEAVYQKLIKKGRMWFGKNGKSRPRVKTYLSERSGVRAWTWWTNQECGNNQEAKKEIYEIIGHEVPFDTPKPSRLLQRILQIATGPDSIILDSFAGSGTTGHAILKQNAEDGGHRRFILVEMDEAIAQTITAERLRRVAAGYKNGKGEQVDGLGGGFQFCRLSKEPLFQADGSIRPDVTFEKLAEFVWLVETGTAFRPTTIRKGQKRTPLLGQYQDRVIFLLFNGILADKSDLGGNVLNGRTLTLLRNLLPARFQGQLVVYGARSRFDKAKLSRLNVIFHQLPYDLAKKTWL